MQSEATATRGVRLKDTGLPAAHRVPREHGDRHEVDAVAMRPLGRGPPDTTRSLDTKRVSFDVPRLRTAKRVCAFAEPDKKSRPRFGSD